MVFYYFHRSKKLKPQQAAFTLVELAIVLVILGLLVSLVLTGKSLIRAAELQSINSDMNQFKIAVWAFRDKHSMFPGDLPNATELWGSSATVNGNGNGKIDYLGGAVGEEYNSWQQLALSGLIPGTFTGGVTSLPISKIKGYYRLSYQTGVYGKSGMMVSINSLNGSLANGAVLPVDDAVSMDLKVDDGLADKGKVLGFNQEGVPGCATNDYTAGSGSYITASTAVKCKLFFKISN